MIQRYIGPYQLSHWLRKHNYTCQVLDFLKSGPVYQFKTKTVYDLTLPFIDKDTLIIGVSSTFMVGDELPSNIVDNIKSIREQFPHIKFVLGGNKAETYKPSTTSLFDCVVVGLAEDILLELVRYYETGQGEPKGFRELPHKVKFYREANEKKFDIQTSDFKWADNDCIQPGEVLPLEVSRGCIFKCKFCQYPLLGRSKFDYTRSMDLIREELIDNYRRFGTTNYYILDDTFNDTVDKVSAFYEMTQSLTFKIRYATYLRADLLDRFPETIKMLKDSGLSGAHFGIESFHPEASKSVGKAWSGKKAKEFLPDLIHNQWNDEVAIHISMIVGIADEPSQSHWDSAKWLYENKIPSWNFKPLIIVKDDGRVFNSEFGKNAESYGYLHTDPTNLLHWEHKSSGWTWPNAVETANAIKDYYNKYPSFKKYDSWSVVGLTTLGYDFNMLLSTPRYDTDKEDMRKRRNNWLKQYLDSVRELK